MGRLVRRAGARPQHSTLDELEITEIDGAI